jgi:hypothetical protein
LIQRPQPIVVFFDSDQNLDSHSRIENFFILDKNAPDVERAILVHPFLKTVHAVLDAENGPVK